MTAYHKPKRAIFDKKEVPEEPPRRAAVDLNSTTDAAVWAKEFWRLFGHRLHELDEHVMLGWFANSIETAREAGRFKALKDAGLDPFAPAEAQVR